MEKIEQFLEECKNSPVAAELVKSADPQSAEEIAKLLAGVAQKLGYDVTEAKLTEYYENVMKRVKEKTDAVAAKIEAESDAALEEAAGGRKDEGVAPNCNDSAYQCGSQYAYCLEVIYW